MGSVYEMLIGGVGGVLMAGERRFFWPCCVRFARAAATVSVDFAKLARACVCSPRAVVLCVLVCAGVGESVVGKRLAIAVGLGTGSVRMGRVCAVN